MFTLKVYDGINVYEYTGDQLGGDAEYDEVLRRGDIEQATVELQVINPTFIGKETVPELPDGPFRCLLQYDYSDSKFASIGKINVMNGRILSETISHSRGQRVWVITIVNDALDEAQRLLENQSVVLSSPVQVETAVVASDGGVDVALNSWYSLEDLFNGSLSAIGDLNFFFQEDNPFFTLSVVYDDSGADTTITRVLPLYLGFFDPDQPLGLTSLDTMQLVEILQSMLGWKLRAEYGTFPSPTITVEVFTDLNVEPVEPAFEIDGLDTGSDRFLEGRDSPEKEDFALSYKNSVSEEPFGTGGQAHVQNAIYASDRVSIDQSGRADNRGITRIDLSVAQIDTVSSGTLAAQQPDPTAHPNYTESILWCRPMVEAKDRVFVCSIVDVSGNNRMVRARQPDNPGTGQVGSTAEYYAIELFKRYAYTSAERFTINGSIFFDQLANPLDRPVVGNPLSGLRIYGNHWRLTGLNWEISTLEAEVTLDRPVNVPVVDIVQPFVCPPRNLDAVVLLVDVDDVTLQLNWFAPVFGCGQQLPVEYEIIVQVPLLGTQIHTVSALSFTNEYVNGGTGTYSGTIRSKAADGTFSSPVGFSVLAEDEDEFL